MVSLRDLPTEGAHDINMIYGAVTVCGPSDTVKADITSRPWNSGPDTELIRGRSNLVLSGNSSEVSTLRSMFNRNVSEDCQHASIIHVTCHIPALNNDRPLFIRRHFIFSSSSRSICKTKAAVHALDVVLPNGEDQD